MFKNFREKEKVFVKLNHDHTLKNQEGFKNLLVSYTTLRLLKSLFVSDKHMFFKMFNKKTGFNLVTRKSSDLRIRFVKLNGRLSKPIHNFKRDINSPVFKDGKYYIGLVVYDSKYGNDYYYVKFDKLTSATSIIMNMQDKKDIYIDDVLESQVHWDN